MNKTDFENEVAEAFKGSGFEEHLQEFRRRFDGIKIVDKSNYFNARNVFMM